jgi:ATP-dependent exoDNAse (exonuclease V) alpha subunit
MKLKDNTIIPIPKMRQKIDKLENQNTFVYRTQFPILNGYSVTIHRVQGVTLKKTHLYLDKTIFCDGQAYVALSRAKNAESVHLLSYDKFAFKTNMEIVDLIEYAKINKTMKNYKSKIDVKNNNINNDDTYLCETTTTIKVRLRNFYKN